MDTKKMTNYKLLLDALSVQIERIVNAAVSAEALGVTPLFDPRGQVSFESAKFEGITNASGKAHTPEVERVLRLPLGGSWILRSKRLRESALQ